MSRAVMRSLGARGRARGAPHNPQQWGGCGVDGLEVPARLQPLSLHPAGAWEAPALQDHVQLSSSTEFSVGGGTMLLEMVSPHAHISTRSQPWVLGCLLGAEHKRWRNWGKASEKKMRFCSHRRICSEVRELPAKKSPDVSRSAQAGWPNAG